MRTASRCEGGAPSHQEVLQRADRSHAGQQRLQLCPETHVQGQMRMRDAVSARTDGCKGAGQAMLQEAGVKAFMNELSCTVVFERPREESFVRKWQVRGRPACNPALMPCAAALPS